MSKEVKYLSQQNPIKLKKETMETDTRKRGKGSRRGKCRSIKEKGTIDLKLKSSCSITSKTVLIQGIPKLQSRKNERPTKAGT